MTAGRAIRDRMQHPLPSTYLAVGLGVALFVFALFGLVAGRAAWGGDPEGALIPRVAAPELECVHSLGFSEVLGTHAAPEIRNGTQVFYLDASAGRIEPNLLEAAPGMPIELRFSRGGGCVERISFDRTAASVRLDEPGATVAFPGLDSGVYPFRCELSKVAGVLIVR